MNQPIDQSMLDTLNSLYTYRPGDSRGWECLFSNSDSNSNSAFQTRNSIFQTRNSIFQTRYSIFQTRNSTFHTRYSIFHTRYSILCISGHSDKTHVLRANHVQYRHHLSAVSKKKKHCLLQEGSTRSTLVVQVTAPHCSLTIPICSSRAKNSTQNTSIFWYRKIHAFASTSASCATFSSKAGR
jgi:hypothetical protein